MRRKSRSKWGAFHRALWASALLHAVAVGVLVLLLRESEKHSQATKGIDTRADEAQVRISLSEENSLRLEPASQPVAKPQAADSALSPALTSEPPQTTPEAHSSAQQLPAKPFAPSVPRTLPPELLSLLRKPGTTPVGGAVVEVPVPAGMLKPPVSDPGVRPAGGVPGSPNTNTGNAPAIHGALTPGKTVVYVLDASGSMGAAGKFDAARAALVSTLRQQPGSVKFQIIVYSGSANPLLTSDASGLAATEANTLLAAEKLLALEPRGRSNHLAAVRAALAFRPDVILLLTDADDLSAAAVKPVLASASKPVVACVGQVTAEGVQRPRELK